MKPEGSIWTGDFTIIPAYESVPNGYYAADEDFMQEWSWKVQNWFGNRKALFFGGSYENGAVEYTSAYWFDTFGEGVNSDIIVAKAYFEQV